MEGTHDDDFTFISLAALTANVMRYLKIDDKKTGGDNKDTAENERNRQDLEQREFVRRRLIEIERFEDRARGQRRK